QRVGILGRGLGPREHEMAPKQAADVVGSRILSREMAVHRAAQTSWNVVSRGDLVCKSASLMNLLLASVYPSRSARKRAASARFSAAYSAASWGLAPRLSRNRRHRSSPSR